LSTTQPNPHALAAFDRARVSPNSERLQAKGLRGSVDDSGEGPLCEPRMYHLIRQHGAIAPRTFKITFLGPCARAYIFTFG
jgi:hypothetical protein